MEIDIREDSEESGEVSIRFSDFDTIALVNSTIKPYLQLQDAEENYDIRLEDIDNLIKALHKAKELWCEDNDENF